MNIVNKIVALNDVGVASSEASEARVRTGASMLAPATAHPQSLLDLPPGEARESLLAVHDILTAMLQPSELAVYEAGGGSTSFMPLEMLERSHVTVVDIDEDQIRYNDYAQEKILGDIQTYRFKPNSFDLVICYNVIEHLADVGAALSGFCQALKPGGLILIGAPNPRSLSGVITKYSPHWVHVWFYRHVRGEELAGRPGHPPFPTFFHPLATRSNLAAFAKVNGLQVIYQKEYESPRYPEMRLRKPVLAAVLDGVARILNLLRRSDGDVRRGDYHMILRKR